MAGDDHRQRSLATDRLTPTRTPTPTHTRAVRLDWRPHTHTRAVPVGWRAALGAPVLVAYDVHCTRHRCSSHSRASSVHQPCGSVRNPCGSVRHPCGSRASPVRNPCVSRAAACVTRASAVEYMGVWNTQCVVVDCATWTMVYGWETVVVATKRCNKMIIFSLNPRPTGTPDFPPPTGGSSISAPIGRREKPEKMFESPSKIITKLFQSIFR